MYSLGLLSIVVLLPIVPAYLLFTALPSAGQVEGRLQGLQIKLGGAFAGYFAVVLLILLNHSILMPPPPYQVWEVKGRVLDDQGNPIEPLDLKDVSVNPPFLDIDKSGYFKLRFYSWPDINGGYAYPRLTVSHANYRPLVVELNPVDPNSRNKANPVQLSISGQHIDLHDISLKQYATPYPNGLSPLNSVGGTTLNQGGAR